MSPKVYAIYRGSQWGSAGTGGLPASDPAGEAPLQNNFLSALHGSGDTWSTSTTQYCEGVATGTTQRGTSGTHAGHPASSPVAGDWVDNASAAPSAPSSAQIAAEAQRDGVRLVDRGGERPGGGSRSAAQLFFGALGFFGGSCWAYS